MVHTCRRDRPKNAKNLSILTDFILLVLFDFEVSNILRLSMGVVTMKLGYFDW